MSTKTKPTACRKVARKQSKAVRRIVRIEPTTKQEGAYVLTTKCQTRMGWHKVGETGTFLNQGEGKGHFFPDRGGVAMNLPCTSVKARQARSGGKPRYQSPPSLAASGIGSNSRNRNSGLCGKGQLQGLANRKVARSCKKKAQTKKRRVLRK